MTRTATGAVVGTGSFSCGSMGPKECAAFYTDSAYDNAWDSWNSNLVAYIATGIGYFNSSLTHTNTAIPTLWDAREASATCYIEG